MTPRRRQIAWSLAWIALAAAVCALRYPPARVAQFAAMAALAASVRWVLRTRSAYLGLALAVGLLGLTAAAVSGVTANEWVRGRTPRLVSLLAGLTCVFTIAALAETAARRRGPAVRALVAAAFAAPVGYAVAFLLAYCALSSARIGIAFFSLPINDPVGRAAGIASVALRPWVFVPLALASIAALRVDRSRPATTAP